MEIALLVYRVHSDIVLVGYDDALDDDMKVPGISFC